MQATLTKKDTNNPVHKHRKENAFNGELNLVVDNKGDLQTLAILRFYTTKQTTYACFWLNDSDSGTHISGSGKSTGWGYHRSSAAADLAFRNAGVNLSADICGRGDSAMEDALKSIAAALGYTRFLVVRAHA